jgi:hypothetical protein
MTKLSSAKALMDISGLMILRWLVIVIVACAIGLVANLFILLLVAFLFAGSAGDQWIWWYLHKEDGGVFVSATILLALIVLPFIRKLKLTW